jgi:predicted RNase H-like HicB family nuclease
LYALCVNSVGDCPIIQLAQLTYPKVYEADDSSWTVHLQIAQSLVQVISTLEQALTQTSFWIGLYIMTICDSIRLAIIPSSPAYVCRIAQWTRGKW